MTDLAREIAHKHCDAEIGRCESGRDGRLTTPHNSRCDALRDDIARLIGIAIREVNNPPPLMRYEDGKVTEVLCGKCGAQV